MLIVINLNCFAQANKWFVSFSFGPAIGGPAASLKDQMKAQGYGDNLENTFVVSGSGTTSYPTGGGSLALLASGGKKITNHKSIYFIAGISEKTTIEGFHAEGWSDGFFGLFAGTYGDLISVSYNTYQFGAGYMYSFPKSRTKLGFGPSIYLFNYGISENYSPKEKHSSIVPGASFNARIPFGKEKRSFGVELAINGNMAPPVKMKSDHTEGFRPKNANMFSANAGIAFSFRK